MQINPKNQESGNSSYLEKTLAILEILAARSPRGVGEISSQLNLEKSSVSRALAALSRLGYAVQLGTRGQYQVGPRVLLLAQPYLQRDSLVREAQPLLHDLATSATASAHLAVMVQGQMIVVAKEPSPERIQVTTRVGSRTPPHASALGKVLLASLSDRERSSLLKGRLVRYTPKTITDSKKLATAIDEVRRRGYALEMEEEIPGVGCIAAPVKDAGGRWIAAVSVSGPIRGTPFKMDLAHRELVIAKAGELSERLALKQSEY